MTRISWAIIALGLIFSLSGCEVGRMGMHLYLTEFIDEGEDVVSIDKLVEDVERDAFCPVDYFFEDLDIEILELTLGRIHYTFWAFADSASADGSMSIHFAEEWQGLFETNPVITDQIAITAGDTVRVSGIGELSPEVINWISDGTFTFGTCFEFQDVEVSGDRFQAEVGIETAILEFEFDSDF